LSKGDDTRHMILRRAAELFNRQGYFGASLSDIMEATGLEKGGIYNHFGSKEDLALEAFDYAVGLVRDEFADAVRGKRDAIERLKGIVGVFRRMPQGWPVPGGCPVMNTAVEADDAHPLLRQRAQQTMDEWRGFIRQTTERGIEKGQIRPEVDPEVLATLLISTLEGAVMMSKLYGDSTYITSAADHLDLYLETAIRLLPIDS
jgi:TetR/AcrR family transcriptional regulator, transcriptional repressor for nem operon